MDIRAFFYFVAFAAACGQFLLSFNKLKGFWKTVPVVLSFALTGAMRYITAHSGPGVGTFPFESGFGLYLFFIMCATGTTIGLASWILWWLLFRKSALTKEKLNLGRAVSISILFALTLFIYLKTS